MNDYSYSFLLAIFINVLLNVTLFPQGAYHVILIRDGIWLTSRWTWQTENFFRNTIRLQSCFEVRYSSLLNFYIHLSRDPPTACSWKWVILLFISELINIQLTTNSSCWSIHSLLLLQNEVSWVRLTTWITKLVIDDVSLEPLPWCNHASFKSIDQSMNPPWLFSLPLHPLKHSGWWLA